MSFLDFRVRSEGCDDPGKTPGTCGVAYIKVNGQDHSPHSRGHNVVIVDAKTGKPVFNDREFSFERNCVLRRWESETLK